MNGIFILTVAFVMATLPNFLQDAIAKEILPIPTECPAENSLNFTVHIAHECDCTKFYKCNFGVKELCNCSFDQRGKRLYFNAREQVCDFRGRSGCTTTCRNSSKEHEWNCRWYYTWQDGRWILRKCKYGYFYDKMSDTCKLASLVNCGDKCPKKGSPDANEGVQLPHECRCNLYYKCNEDGDSVKKKCPNNEEFDDDTRTCVSSGAHCNGTHPSNKPHEWNCRWYYTWQGGKWFLRKCKYGDFYDKISDTCKLASLVNCTDKCPKKGSPDANEGVQLPHECRCNLYYKCNEDGDSVKKKCPNNEEFDDDTRTCVSSGAHCNGTHPSNKPHEWNCRWYYTWQGGKWFLRKCKYGDFYDKISDTCKSASRVNCTDECPRKGSPGASEGVRLPHDCECNLYYECNEDGDPTRKECPNNQEFDDDTRQCLPNGVGVCPNSSPCPSDDTVRLPHKCMCNRFYECKNGRRHLQSCDEGLYFDPRIQFCVVSENESCKLDNHADRSNTLWNEVDAN